MDKFEVLLNILIVLVYVPFFYNLTCLYRNFLTNRWAKTSGEIISADWIMVEGGDAGDAHDEPKIKYRYNVNGKNYVSEKIMFGLFGNYPRHVSSLSPPSKKVNFLKKIFYRIKFNRDDFSVYYNPVKPWVSVLITGVQPLHIRGVIFYLFFGLFFHLLIKYM